MTARFHPRVNPTVCHTGPRPGTARLQMVLLDITAGTFDWGVYNCRNVRGGSTLSHHADGRAGDLGIPFYDGAPNRVVGDPIAALLIANAWELGLDHLIWNRVIWDDRSPKGRPFIGTTPTLRHEDHIHYGQTLTAAVSLTETQIRNTLQPEEENDMTPEQEKFLNEMIASAKAVNTNGHFVKPTVELVRSHGGIIAQLRQEIAAAASGAGGTIDHIARQAIAALRDHLRGS